MPTTLQFDDQLRQLLEALTNEGVTNAARGFSSMVGQTLQVSKPHLRLTATQDITQHLGGVDSQAVGIYLRAEGDLSGQIMLILDYAKALELADLVMGEAPGTTQALGSMERSALGELGNLTGAFFLNGIAASTGLQVRPSPPAVIVDIISAIIDIATATQGGQAQHVLMMQTTFFTHDRQAQADLWVIPDTIVLHSLQTRHLTPAPAL